MPEIDEFWSHSWHGEARRKILLLLLKNGPAAILMGTLGALAMMLGSYRAMFWFVLHIAGPDTIAASLVLNQHLLSLSVGP